jgi:hypothetical protein
VPASYYVSEKKETPKPVSPHTPPPKEVTLTGTYYTCSNEEGDTWFEDEQGNVVSPPSGFVAQRVVKEEPQLAAKPQRHRNMTTEPIVGGGRPRAVKEQPTRSPSSEGLTLQVTEPPKTLAIQNTEKERPELKIRSSVPQESLQLLSNSEHASRKSRDKASRNIGHEPSKVLAITDTPNWVRMRRAKPYNTTADATKKATNVASHIFKAKQSRSMTKEIANVYHGCMASRILEGQLDEYHGYGIGTDTDVSASLKGLLSGGGDEKERRERRAKDLSLQMYYIIDLLKEYAESGSMSFVSQDPRCLIDESVVRIASKLISKHGDVKCNGFLWMPNASKLHTRNPPTGFAFGVLVDDEYPTKLAIDIFSAPKMFYGTFAVRVSSSLRTEEGLSPIDVISRFRPSELADILKSSEHMEQSRKLLKNGRGSYMGVYAQSNRDFGPWEPSVWVVIQCGNEDLSQQFYKLISGACSSPSNKPASEDGKTVFPYATWERTLFMEKKSDVRNIKRKIEDTRVTAAVSVLRALGFTSVAFKDVVQMSHVDTMTNCFNHNRHTNSYVYYSGCTPITKDHRHYSRKTLDVKHTSAVIVQETPDRGPVILRGPPEATNPVLGGQWSPIRGVFQAFPCVTGRTKNLLRVPKGEWKALDGFTWPGKKEGDKHPRLSSRLYRTRTHALKSLERTLGWDPLWGTIELRPRGVLMAPPPEKSLIDTYS